MKKLTVDIGRRSYPIFVGARLRDLGAYLKKQGFSRRVLVVSNPTVKRLHFAPLAAGLKEAGFAVSLALMPDGEKYKNLATVSKLYGAALKAKLDRRSPLIALGGGVTGDVAGFVAATYLRGVPLVQVPTTLLAMVDSSIGGKTGFDLAEGKNLVGSFYQPRAVWIDPAALATLPARQLRNGMAEVIKYGVIADAKFFAYLCALLGRGKTGARDYEEIVYRCCAIKARVVSQDEFEEKGVREILNFGHTYGHALETLTGYTACLHGEAVAAGMVVAGRLALKLGLFSLAGQEALEGCLAAAGLPLAPERRPDAGKLISVMRRDKKAREGRLRFVLPLKIGKVTVRSAVPERYVREVVP